MIKNLLSNLSIRSKLHMQIGLAFLGMSLMIFISLSVLHTNLLEDRKMKTRHLVEAAHSILNHFEARVSAGELLEHEAKAAAIVAIKSMRYDENEYFWLNDMRPTMIMHPLKPQLDGKDLTSFEDPAGKRLFVEFTQLVRKKGAGFVPYLWPKPGSEEPVAKISYVKGFQAWGWVIGSGIYVDDISAIFWEITSWEIGISLVLALFIMGISARINHSIINPIKALREVMSKVIDNGDFSQRVEFRSSNELGLMSTNFNSMLDKIQAFVDGIYCTSQRLTESAQQMSIVSGETKHNTLQQRTDTEMVATAMNQMSASVQEISINAVRASEETAHANQTSNEGASIAKSATQSIGSLAIEVENASQVIHRLESDAADIGSVLDVIRGIAEQTNLLALNAAIEAARAGEQGRGFAVVADEVRTLAQRTQESTQEIQAMIETVQQATCEAVQVMEKGRNQTLNSVAQTEEIGRVLESIVAAVAEINDINLQIASATEEQSAVSKEINGKISNISQLAGETSTGAENTSVASQDSLQLANDLEDMAKQLTAGKAITKTSAQR